MAELRGALIGCGFFAMNHLNAWRDIEGASIVAICDRSPERLKVAGDQFGIERRYSDAAEMLAKEKLDFVDVATTAPSHKALVELVAGHGLPVICQKPFAPTIAEGKAMVAACKKANVPLMVHENFRWQSPIMKVKQVIDGGEIGRPFWARISFRTGYDIFTGQPYLAEGERFIVEDLGVHALDVARFLLGDARHLSARTTRVNPRVKGEDTATVLMDHGNGVTSVVDCSYSVVQDEDLFPQTLVELNGTEGSVILSAGYKLTVATRSGARHENVDPPVLPWASRPWHNVQESVFNIQRHWVDCLRTGRQPATSGEDNLKTFALVEAAYESAATGNTVDVMSFLR